MLLFSLAFIPALSAFAADGVVRVAGSDLLGNAISDLLLTEAESRSWKLNIGFSGSLRGREAMLAGDADVAILGLAPGDSESVPDSLRMIPLAFEAVAIVVHQGNPVQEASVVDLANLFAPTSGDFARWDQAGARGEWADRQAMLHAARSRNSLLLEIFNALVLGPREISESVTYWEDVGSLLRHIAANPTSVGLVPAVTDLPAGTRALYVRRGDSAAYGPTPEAILHGDYGIRVPFVIAISESATEEATDVARFLLSDALAGRLRKAGYVPSPSVERRQFQLELDLRAEERQD